VFVTTTVKPTVPPGVTALMSAVVLMLRPGVRTVTAAV